MIVRRLALVTLLHHDAVETAEGFRLYDAHFARTGLQDYDDGKGGRIVEYRPDEEVDASIPSYELRPLTDLHPPKNVTTDSVSMFVRGAVSGAHWAADGVHVAGRLAVWHADLIRKFDAAARAGKPMQLSAGYTLDLDPTPGEYQGRRYDAIQRNIRINHVAAVPLGRAGTAQVLDRFDGWDVAQARSFADIAPHHTRTVVDMGRWCRHDAANLREPLPQDQDEPNMKKITLKIDGKDVVVEVADNATAQDIANATSKAHADAATAREATRKAEQDAAIAAAVAKAKADMAPPFGKIKPEDEEAAKKALGDAEAKQKADAAALEQRLDTLATARVVIGLGYKADGLDADTIRLDVIERVLGKADRADAESDRGAIGYVFRRAVAKYTTDNKQDHAGVLLDEIRGAVAGRSDVANKPTGTITQGRKDAAAQAALPRHEREAQKAG